MADINQSRRRLFGLAAGAALVHAAPGTVVAGFMDGVAAKESALANFNAAQSFFRAGLGDVLRSMHMQIAFHPIHSRLSYQFPQVGHMNQHKSIIAHACANTLDPYDKTPQVLFSWQVCRDAIRSYDIEWHLKCLPAAQVIFAEALPSTHTSDRAHREAIAHPNPMS